MTYDNERQKFGRERIDIVEIDFEKCALTYGNAPCTAAVGTTGSEKCKNSFATCQDLANYDGSDTLTVRCCSARSPHPIGIDAIPNISGKVSVTPSKIDLKGGLGERARLTVDFNDHPHADRDIDPYVDERTYDPLDRGTFWTKVRAIWPNYQFRNVRHESGYIVNDSYDAANFQTRYYVVDSLDVSNGRATLSAVDPLKLAMKDKALMPAPNSGKLSATLSAGATSFTVTPSGVGDDEYDSSGFLTIDKEVMSFTRSGDNFTVTRAQYNTEAKEHSEDSTVQQAYQKNDQVNVIVEDALGFTNIDSSLIPSSEWQTEIDTYLNGLLDGIIVKPMDVKKVLQELAEAAPHYLWWDERNQKIRLTALKAPPNNADTLDMDENLIQGVHIKDKPDMRVSTVFVSYGQINPTEKLDEINNFEQTYVRIDTDSIAKYGTSQIKSINSRWIASNNTAGARTLAALIGRRFSDIPREINFKLDPKDSDLWLNFIRKINHRDILDPTSSLPLDTMFQVTSARENDNEFDYKGLEFLYGDELPEDEGGGNPAVDLVIINSDRQNINLRTEYDSLFPTPDASTQAKFIIDNGNIIGSSSAATVSLDTGSWPAGATITLQVNNSSYVVGAGGDGDNDGSAPGESGGKAIILNHDLELINNGIVGGGGGGGGGATTGSAIAGGGGGAGNDVGLRGGGNADDGTLENGGNADSVTVGFDIAFGGDGGDLGQAGSAGSGSTSSAGGAAGAAIDKNGYTLTETTTGDIRGTILT